MQTFTRTYPDGIKGTYTVAPGSSLPMTLATLKPFKRKRATADKRQFPGYAPGYTSTRDYVNAYFGLNSNRKIAAYDNYTKDWLSLYQPLPDEPAAVYTGADTVETVADWTCAHCGRVFDDITYCPSDDCPGNEK